MTWLECLPLPEPRNITDYEASVNDVPMSLYTINQGAQCTDVQLIDFLGTCMHNYVNVSARTYS